MADTLTTIDLIAGDPIMLGRFNAAAGQHELADPVTWAWDRRYNMAAAPGWAAAVDSWQVSHPAADPPNGWATDQAVISDGMIVAQLQALLTPS